MTWLDPMTGLIALGSLVPPLLALYVLRLRRKTREVPSTVLWQQSTADIRANVPFQRLRFSVLLLLQFAVLALLAMALAQPEREGGARAGHHAILVDRSLSMQAHDGGAESPTRLDRAKQAAQARIDALHSGGFWQGENASVMVVAFGGDPTLACGFTDSQAIAQAAVESIQPFDGGSSMGEALALVRSALVTANPDDANAGPPEDVVIEVFSDGNIDDTATLSLAAHETLVFRQIGDAATANRSVVSLGMSRDARDPALVKALARLVHWGSEEAAVELELLVDGKTRTVLPTPVTLPPASVRDGQLIPGEVEVTFPAIALPDGGVVEARCVEPDALPDDDAAWLVVPPARQLRLALVGTDEFVLTSALESLSPAQLELLTLEEFGRRATEDPSFAASFDVIVMLAPYGGVVPAGRYLWFGDPTGLPGVDAFGRKEAAVAVGARTDHALLRYVNLDELVVRTHSAVVPTARGEVIIDGSEGPLVLTLSGTRIQAVVVPFDPLDSNWPFQRGFLNFTSNAIHWLAAFARPIAAEPRTPGAMQRVNTGRPGVSVQALHESGQVRSASSSGDGLAVVGPLDRLGLWTLTWAGAEAPVPIAVASPGAAEARAGALSELRLQEAAAARGGASAKSGSQRSALWPWLMLAAIAVLAAEWWWYLRQV